jgi:CHAT domain-containing protein
LLAEILAASDTARAGLVREFATGASVDSKEAQDSRDLAAEIALQEYLLQRAEYGYTQAADGAPLRDRLSDLRARFDSSAAHLPPTGGGFLPAQYSWERLPADVAVLSFVHSSAGLRRYLFTREGPQELPVVALAPVISIFDGLRHDITNPAPGNTTAELASLSKLLLGDAPALAGKRRWVVVADATTSEVPFAALSVDPKSWRPVILDHELSLALTTRDALALARDGAAARRTNLARVAIFADPVFSPIDTRVKNFKGVSQSRPYVPTPRLAATAHEAQSIAQQLAGVDVKVFSGFDATRDAVLSPYVNAATVLHFATHASSSDAWPHGSGLMLSGVDREGEVINGYLSTLDLLMSRRATDLVVLSACDTARGESTQTENVAGLARAFLGSGARRVVGTLWAVEDAATATLMSGFYQRLARGGNGGDRAVPAPGRLGGVRALRERAPAVTDAPEPPPAALLEDPVDDAVVALRHGLAVRIFHSRQQLRRALRILARIEIGEFEQRQTGITVRSRRHLFALGLAAHVPDQQHPPVVLAVAQLRPERRIHQHVLGDVRLFRVLQRLDRQHERTFEVRADVFGRGFFAQLLGRQVELDGCGRPIAVHQPEVEQLHLAVAARGIDLGAIAELGIELHRRSLAGEQPEPGCFLDQLPVHDRDVLVAHRGACRGHLLLRLHAGRRIARALRPPAHAAELRQRLRKDDRVAGPGRWAFGRRDGNRRRDAGGERHDREASGQCGVPGTHG